MKKIIFSGQCHFYCFSTDYWFSSQQYDSWHWHVFYCLFRFCIPIC